MMPDGENSLNVDAKEFVPKHVNYKETTGEFSGNRENPQSSGAVPKKSTNYRRYEGRFRQNDNQKNWRNRNYTRSERADFERNPANSEHQNGHSKDRKFYRNNQQNIDRGYSKFKITIKPAILKDDSTTNEDSSKRDIENIQPKDIINGNTNNKSVMNHHQKSRNRSNNNNHSKKYSHSKISISQRDQLIKEIERNRLECMICCDKIKSYNPVWSCKVCFHIQHLHCIKTWMKKSKEFGLRCPACNQLCENNKPSDYMCFCGKLKNPPVNQNDLPHTCGNMCLSTSNCQHPCNLQCHPGPHETCHALVNKFCGCGKTSKSYQCSMKATFECDGICEKSLNCNMHKCPRKCHQDDCQECTEIIECKCFCGAETKKLTCTAENLDKTEYSCEKECGKMLTCGNHKCTDICHSGECKPCKLLPEVVKTCPCKRLVLKPDARKSCADPIPLCQSVCKKPLKCGPLAAPHLCTSICHTGNCSPCQMTSNVKCRCGRKEEKIPCKDLNNTDLRCKKKCNKFKSCGRHKCNIECCIDIDHTCMQNCNRLLDCGKHKCQKTCHIGNCPPCHRVSFDELRCECGLTVVFPPVKCGVVIKDCSNKCTRSHSCDHPVGHNCHPDPECPPCVFLTTKLCYGKHEERKTIPCNQESFSCGMPCKKLLKCGRHDCIKICHQGDCEKPGEICTQKCTKKRIECEHNCNAKCHEDECPENVACRERIQVTCPCGNLKGVKTCEQVEYENRKLQRIRLTSQQNDEATTLNEMLGDFKKTTKILECNDECKTIERNRRLDIAFKIQNPTLATTPKFTPVYSEHVRNYYKKDPNFVNMVHSKLTELVKLAKETKNAAYRCHSFPSMNRDKRHVIHDLGELFGIETKAFDAEPNRNIVATAFREYCWIPSMSYAEVFQKENGIRRPPVQMSQLFKKQ